MLEVSLRPVPRFEKHLFSDYFQAYLAELSVFSGARPDQHGRYYYDMFDHYWLDERRMPHFIESGDETVGLLLLRELGETESSDGRPALQLAELCVFREHRRRAVAREVMRLAARIAESRRVPLTWSAYRNNGAANALYRSVLREFAGQTGAWRVEQTPGVDTSGVERVYYRLIPVASEKAPDGPQEFGSAAV